MLIRLHINEIDNDNTAHIPQSQLPGYLPGCFEIHLQGICLLVSARFGPVAAVYVNYMQSLCMFYNEVGAMPE